MKAVVFTATCGAIASLNSTLGAVGLTSGAPVNLWTAVVPLALLLTGLGTTAVLTWKVASWVNDLRDLGRRLDKLEQEKRTR